MTYVDPLGLFRTAGAADALEGLPSDRNSAGTARVLEGETGRTQRTSQSGNTPSYFNPLSGSKELFNKSTKNDWLELYTHPTYAGNERTVNLPASLAGHYGQWLSHEKAGGAEFEYINMHAYEQIKTEGRDASWYTASKDFVRTVEGRYWVAVGPKILEPNYPDTGKNWASDFKYGTKLDALVVDDTGNRYYVPCIVGDVKNHTFINTGNPDNGYYHTDIPYPETRQNNGKNPDYSVIEFIRSTTIGNAKDLSRTGLK